MKTPAQKKKIAQPEVDQVFKAPVILRQPSNRSAIVGGRCFIQIAAHAVPMPKYQWFHNGRPISGATGPRHLIPKVRQSDVGNYTCEVKNMVGSVMSKQVTIMLTQAQIPDFEITPASLSVKPGERATFAIKFTGQTPFSLNPYAIQWYCNGRKIRGAEKPELDIKRCDESLSGEFAVKLTLKVNAHAYRISEPSHLTVGDGVAKVKKARKTPLKVAPPAPAPEEEDSFFSFGQDPEPKPALRQKKKALESALVQLQKYRRAKALETALTKLVKLRSRRAPSKAC